MDDHGCFALRTAQPSDLDFEHFLYASTARRPPPLGPEVFDGLVGMQFRAHTMSIRVEHPRAERKIVVVEDVPAGRLITDSSGDHIEVIDVALLPEFRVQGIGTSVMRNVLAHADRLGRAVQLHVEKQNRAVRLDERLGFAISGDVGMYFAMSRTLAAGW
ncbi:MAG: GNAT family N-acetyltransferase [Ilumatobacteraceae bacterium]